MTKGLSPNGPKNNPKVDPAIKNSVYDGAAAAYPNNAQPLKKKDKAIVHFLPHMS